MLTLDIKIPVELEQALFERAKIEEMSIEECTLHLIQQSLEVNLAPDPKAVWGAVVSSCENAANLAPGSTFHLKDLVPEHYWEKLSPGDRKQVGKKFRQTVTQRNIAKFLARSSNNHAIYERL